MNDKHSDAQAFEVRRNDLASHRLVSETVDAPAEGRVLLAIDRFALTANNITYGVTGDLIGYWRFFPAQGGIDGGWGRLPVWGFGDVLSSTVAGIDEGQRYYGYFPMASHLTLRPTRVSERGFVDAIEHRAELPVIYNQYQRCDTDPGYRLDREALQLLFRPLFTTAFSLDDFLADNGFFGARRVLLSSASSKTAFGLAWLLHRNRRSECQVIGLTSPGNAAFVASLGCYDEVVCYEEVPGLPQEPSVFVDMAGNAALRATLHQHLSEQLRYSCSVGATHWEQSQMSGNDPLPGPRPTMFFAPSQIQKRVEDWGHAELARRTAQAWDPFVAQAADWLTIREERGVAALEARYLALLENRARPSDAFVLSL